MTIEPTIIRGASCTMYDRWKIERSFGETGTNGENAGGSRVMLDILGVR